jgi:hypothetical protein
MVEIIVIWRLTVYIGNIAKQKGVKKIGYQVMAVLLWICGELVGGMLGTIIFGAESSFWLRYVIALIGAVGGAGIAFLIMRFIPNQETVLYPDQTETEQVSSPAKKFGRSQWIPALVGIVTLSCICLVGVWAVFSAQVRSLAQQIRATDPIIGTKLNAEGQIAQALIEIPSQTEAIYMSFYFYIPVDQVTEITFDWSINGQPTFSTTENVRNGPVITKLDRAQLGLPEFAKGNYTVNVRMGTFYLVSTSFIVK